MNDSVNEMIKWISLKSSISENEKVVLFLSSFTSDLIESSIGVNLYNKGIPSKIEFGEYNQILQNCMNKDGRMYDNDVAVTVVWPRIEELTDVSKIYSERSINFAVEDVKYFSNIILSAAKKIPGKMIFVLPASVTYCPAGEGDLQTLSGMSYLSLVVRKLLLETFVKEEKIILCDCEQVIRRIGSSNAIDARMYAAAKVPYTNEMFHEMGVSIANTIYMATERKQYVLVCDVANLLSDEISDVIENEILETLDGIAVTENDLMNDIRAYFRILHDWGIRFVFASSSTKKTVERILQMQSVNLLSCADFLCTDCKTLEEAMEKTKEEYGIEKDQLVCLSRKNENQESKWNTIYLPRERAFWCQTIQESGFTVQMPDDVEINVLDGLALEEKQEKEVGEQNFFDYLKLQVNLSSLKKEQFEQVNEILLNFNEFCTKDYKCDKLEYEKILCQAENKWYGIYVKDRFGDYGMAGIVAGHIRDECFSVDTLKLSCRVLGKQTEYMIFNQLMDNLNSVHIDTIEIQYENNGYNKEIIPFLADMGNVSEQYIEDEKKCTLTLKALKDWIVGHLDWKDAETVLPENQVQKTTIFDLLKESWEKKSIEVQEKIRESVNHQEDVKNLMADISKVHWNSRSTTESEYIAPRTDTEKKLVEMWRDILHIDKIGVKDNFFSMGGTSIMATQLVLKFEEVFGIRLPIRIFVDKSDIEQMAMHIEAMLSGEDWNVQNENARNIYRYNMRQFLKDEIWLDDTIMAGTLPKEKKASECKKVLLTGATGFLGGFVLADLLRETDYEIYCLVRADDTEKGMDRIVANLKGYQIWESSYSSRITVVCGDISKPLLGLEHMVFEKLGDEMDMIYHCAANTSFVVPYQVLKASNVLGTQEILRLATTGRLKTVQHVSTTYVFSTLSNPYGFVVDEDQIPSYKEVLILGYQQSKLVSEQLVRIARERGIPVNIFRAGRISGSSVTGAAQSHDLVWMMIKASIETGMLFEEVESVDLVPVDYVSKALVKISQYEPMQNKNYHLVNKKRTSMESIYQWMQRLGYQAEIMPYKKWKDNLIALAKEHPEMEAVNAIIPLLSDNTTAMAESIFYSTKNVDLACEEKDVQRIEITEEIFDKYINYFTNLNFLQKVEKEEG